MINSTQFFLKRSGFFLLGLLLSLTWNNANAQNSHTLTVNAPAAIAGNYNAEIAAFGATFCSFSSISGDIVLVKDGTGGTLACDTIVNDLTGKIALVDRGACNFSIKVYEAQQKGAIAVLVANNAATAIFSMGTGANANLVTIPAFMISQANGNAIKSQLANGVNVTITRNDIVDNSGDIVVWGNNPGEGDFDGGLNGWTVVSGTCADGSPGTSWTWSAVGTMRGSCGGNTVASPTRCNGTVVFETDFLDSGTNACGSGGGTCPAPQFGELISPNIDLSGSDAAGFSLKFYQVSRQFTSNYFVAWTTDGGINWDTTAINTELVTNAAATANVVKVPLVGTGGADSLRVKLIYEANYYYWGIDDVQIIEQESNNLRTNTFFAVPNNAIFPLDNAEPFGFLADIENVGALDQTNVNLNVTIEDFDGNEVYSQDLDYGTVPANSLVENVPFAEKYLPTETGTFFGTYTVSADAEDFDESNNTQEFAYIVSDTTFAKEYSGANSTTSSAAGNWDANEPHSWAWGNYYYVANADNKFVRSATISVLGSAALAGRELVITLYKWTEDTNQDGAADPDERELLAFNSYTIVGNETAAQFINVPMPAPGDPVVALEDNTAYLLMIEYITNDQVDYVFPIADYIDYGGMITLTNAEGAPRFGSMLGINGDLSTEPFNFVGFTGALFSRVPVARMNVGADPTSSEELNALASKFTVFPNPTTDVLNVQLGLDKTAQSATVRIFDMAGKLMQQRQYDNVQQERFQYNINNLSSGTYFIQLITEEGAGTKKFIVNK